MHVRVYTFANYHVKHRPLPASPLLRRPMLPTARLLSPSLFLLLLLPFATAIKFVLSPAKIPTEKCIWNAAHPHALVVVTANVGPGPSQRIDIEIIDSTPQRNVYLSKKDIKGETRLAVTAHAEGEIGVCFKNHLAPGPSSSSCCVCQGMGLNLHVDVVCC